MLLTIFVQTVILFENSLMKRMFKRMAFILKVLAVTFDQFNVLFIIHESLIFINESW